MDDSAILDALQDDEFYDDSGSEGEVDDTMLDSDYIESGKPRKVLTSI